MQRGRILAAVVATSLCVGATTLTAVGAATASPTPVTAGGLGAAMRLTLGTLSGPAQANAAATPAAVALGAPIPGTQVHDPTGDAQFAQGDLTAVGMMQNVAGTSFGASVAKPTSPANDRNWILGYAAIDWFLDANRDGLPEYVIAMGDNTQGKLIAFVSDLQLSRLFCNATATFFPGVGYRVNVPAGCLPRVSSVQLGAGMIYSPGPVDSSTPIDFAPDNLLSGPISVQEVHGVGYWMLGADGHVYPFGGAVGFPGLVPGAVAMAPRKDGKGYWVVDFVGHVFAYGSAHFFGGTPALGAGESVSTISATPNGNGYWLFSNRGRAFPFGNASSYGDMAGTHLNGPIVASVATPTGRGYYMVGSDGGIFSFGDARFHGSTGGMRLNKPVVGIAPTPNGKGYWLVASDGGVFAFDAPFRGSMGSTQLNRAVDGLVAFGNGYLMAASDGGIFDFSDQPFLGGLAGTALSAPIIGLAAFAS
jgi:hypothetical protein